MENTSAFKDRISIKNPPVRQDFADKYCKFLTSLDNLRNSFETLGKALNEKKGDLAGTVIFYLGVIVWEDFNEILFLSANGLVAGAKKILRGMFERVVTANYLHTHQDETELFWNYYWIDQHKWAADLAQVFAINAFKENLLEVESQYQRVKELYQVPVCRVCKFPECEECKKTRTNHNWSKKDIVTMAKEVGIPVHVIIGAYYFPLIETHPKAVAIFDRIRSLENKKSDKGNGEPPLVIAHALLINLLEVSYEHFKIEGMKELIGQAVKNFQASWKEYT
jgi:uncharacterized protein DUF5677